MKFVKCMFCIIVLSLLATACSPQNPADAGSSASNESEPQAYSAIPLYFDSEEQLLNTISEVKSAKGKTGAEDAVVSITSNTVGEQTYRTKSDMFKLSSISEFYRPQYILKGTSFKEIHVRNEYISYWYANEDQIICATFTWFREMSPEAHMSELDDHGAISEREIEYNGIKYVFLEWMDPETGESDGYSIFWVKNSKAYKASVLAGYTDDEMLAFCQFETVPVK